MTTTTRAFDESRSWRPMAILARAFGITEGQAVTLFVTLVVTLALTLGGLPSVLRELVGLPGAAGLADPASASASESAPGPPPPDRPDGSATVTSPPVSATTTETPPTSVPTESPPPTTDAPPPDDDGSTGEPTHPCDEDPGVAAASEAVQAADGASGGAAPDQSLIAAIAVASGCSDEDPAVVLVAMLVELGEGLSDPGLDPIGLPPPVPFELPPAVIDAVQPARPALDEVCNAVRSVWGVLLTVGEAYPYPVEAVFVRSVFYTVAICDQIQQE